jgi:hypothetical protein
MQSILVDVRGYTRIVVVSVNIVVAIVASVVGHQIGREVYVVEVVKIKAIQVPLVLAVIGTRVVIHHFIAVNFPT